MVEKIKVFEKNLLTGNLEGYGFKKHKSPIMPSQVLGDIEICYYGGDLCEITIGGRRIEELIDDIPGADGPDDELCYRLTEGALEFLMNKIKEEEGGVIDQVSQ